jgi:hypothetical protein
MTRRSLPAHLQAALLLVGASLACANAAAQTSAPPPKEDDASAAQQDIYLNALQSIAEGRRNDASRELRLLIDREPAHVGAWLDLALTQCALGHSDEAERLFANIETRFPLSDELRRVIAEAREQGCNYWHPSSAWSMNVARGADQNVNQGALSATYVTQGRDGPLVNELSADFRPQHDQYTTISGDYSRDVSANGAIGFAQFAVRRNDRLHKYDNGALFTGLEMPWRVGPWGLRASATGGLVTLGGSLYQRQVQLQGRVQPPLPLPSGMQFNLLLGATYNGFLTLTNFNSNVWEARGQLSWRRADTSSALSFGRLTDRALAQRPGGDRHGWFANAVVRHRFGERLSVEGAATRQTWNSALPYAPGLIDDVRAQSALMLRTSLTWHLTKSESVQLEARSVRNRENISIFQYNNRQLQLSWQWQGS